jgi:DNA-nicking Smr family endonuclease
MSKKRAFSSQTLRLAHCRVVETAVFIGFNTSVKRLDSIYQVFGDLPLFIRANDSRPPTEHEEQSHADRGSKPPPDEDCVFKEAMKDVKLIAHDRQRIPGENSKHNLLIRTVQRRPAMADTLSDAYPITVGNLPEYMEGYADGLSPTIMERLRNEEFSVQETLDLHGLSSVAAAELFSEFLDRAIHKGTCCIKVIHGRGLRSKNGPVLKECLKGWLVRAIHRKWIVAFCSAQMSRGGPGATLILLRTQPKKKKLTIVG